MTGLASHAAMPALEFVLAAFVVIELPQLPVARAVARLTGFAEFELVRVILLVARVTLARRVLVATGLVALLAVDRDVATGQREFSATVIERRRVPVAIDVALLAALALLALMLVVLLVACVTLD